MFGNFPGPPIKMSNTKQPGEGGRIINQTLKAAKTASYFTFLQKQWRLDHLPASLLLCCIRTGEFQPREDVTRQEKIGTRKNENCQFSKRVRDLLG